MAYHWLTKPKLWLYCSLSMLLALMIACGAAEESPAETGGTTQSAAEQAATEQMQEPAGPPPAAQRQPSTGMEGGSGGTTSGTESMEQPAEAAPAPTAVPQAMEEKPMVDARQVDRLEFAITSANNETNRPWKGSRQAYVQYDPTLDYAIGIHPTTSEYVPELAHKWEANDDLSEWTFWLREGIEFHNGWGELTADDFLHTAQVLTRPDTRLGTWRYFVGGRNDDGTPLAGPDKYFTKIDDHTFTVTFHGRDGNPSTTFDAEFVMSNASSEMGPWSKSFWESVGGEGDLYYC
ncbi:MAG: ABC transporter substrate-binding protein, partial [Chloroflexota bacterium]|nr:ABC transporter substrate-binding protein [Chloroflexota bacterium]